MGGGVAGPPPPGGGGGGSGGGGVNTQELLAKLTEGQRAQLMQLIALPPEKLALMGGKISAQQMQLIDALRAQLRAQGQRF